MPRYAEPPWKSYLVAALAVVVAFAAEYVTWPWLKATPLALFFAPVIVGAVRGGMGPALLATALAVPLCNYFFIAPYGAFSLDPSGIASTLVLVVVSLLIGALTDSVVSRGIAERVRAAETLRQERDFAESLIEAAQAIVLVLDPAGRIVRTNPYWEELAGYQRDELRGKDWSTTFVTEGDRPRTGEAFSQLLAGTKSTGFVNLLVTKSGRERTIEWSSKALKDATGSTLGVLAIGHDITELRATRERALQAERLAAIGEMVDGLAHESRNALYRGQACLEMLALEVEDRPEALRLIDRLQRAQDDLLTLYEDVQGYAAPIHLERRVCDLAETWRAAWAHLAPLREGREAVLREESGGLDLHGAVDPSRLEQVFRNLLENSLAACRDPVAITIRCTPAEIDGHPALRVAVRDHGPGLGPEQRQRLFEPFYTTKTKGTGLGMAIAKRIVEAHGGRIAVGEDGGPGAEILLTLPRGAP